VSEDRIEPLDADLLALVDAEHQRPDMPAGVQDRLLNRLEVTISDGDGGLGNGADTDGSTPTRLGRFFARRIPFGVAAFTLGALAGAGIHAALRRPAPLAPSSAPAPGVPASGPSYPVEPKASSAAPAPVPPTSRRPTRRPPSQAPATVEDGEPDTELAAERALVETARTAMARGDVAGALEVLERDGRRFPKGRLVEERESLQVQALTKVGRVAEARALGIRFRKEFPRSMLLPVVDEALKTIP